MAIYIATITYACECDIYIAEFEIDAPDYPTAFILAEKKFEAEYTFEDIKEITIEAVPIGI